MKTPYSIMQDALKPLALTTLILGSWLGTTSAMSQETASPTGAEVGDLITVTAEVVDIDKSKRELTLKGPEGDEVTIEVGDEVENFKKIKVGDQVEAAYYESISISKGAAGTPEVVTDEVLEQAPKGEKPGIVAATSVQISVTVVNIDRENRILTVRRDDGSEMERQVDPSIAAFDDLKIGDAIQVEMIRAMAVSVTPKK